MAESPQKVKVKVAHSCLFDCDSMDCPWNSPGQTTGVHSLSLLQGVFPTQRSNPGLLHCRQILYQLSHKGKPKNTGVGSLSLLGRIFPTQGSNPGLSHCRRILCQLSHKNHSLKVDKVSTGPLCIRDTQAPSAETSNTFPEIFVIRHCGSCSRNLQVGLGVKAGDVRDTGSTPGPGRSPGRGHGNPLHYPCLENPMDRGAWRATVHGVIKGMT